MLVGYNTNVPYKGKLYHVQTEDNGLKNPVIITLLYYKGTILASRKISYERFANSPDYKEKVREIMKEQHRTMMKELIRGIHTGENETEVRAKEKPLTEASLRDGEDQSKAQISKGLDDILLDYIVKEGG